MEATVGPAEVGEAEHLLGPPRTSFRTEAALHDHCSFPPPNLRLCDLLGVYDARRILAARLGTGVVGSVPGRLVGDTCHSGRLVVYPRRGGRGLGTPLVREIEARYQEADRFGLATGHRGEGSPLLRRRLGDVALRRERHSRRLDHVHPEKRRPRPPAASPRGPESSPARPAPPEERDCVGGARGDRPRPTRAPRPTEAPLPACLHRPLDHRIHSEAAPTTRATAEGSP